MFHRSRRLFLRPIFPEDWEALYERIADRAIVRNLARAPWPYAPEDAQAYAARGQDMQCPGFTIFLPSAQGETLIGGVGFGEDEGEIELGYWIARDHWGRGFATEAVCGLLQIGRMLGYERIVAGHFLDNPASGRVLEKSGFAPTGRVLRRFSCARGEEVPMRQFAIRLDEAVDTPEPRAA